MRSLHSIPRKIWQEIGKLHEESKRGWFSGRIVPCHGTDPGSIPGSRSHFVQAHIYAWNQGNLQRRLTLGSVEADQRFQQLPADAY